jgi:hypothetical protein
LPHRKAGTPAADVAARGRPVDDPSGDVIAAHATDPSAVSQLVITIKPHFEVRQHGLVHVDKFEAYLGERLLLISRTPFLSSARLLLKAGVDPTTRLIMRHHGRADDALRATVGAAAKLTVKETGRGPTFAPWNAFPTKPVRPSSAPPRRK